ncbi:F510_1955 family glycosylhydrolase [Oryzobacter terrae]|uniref:F510_1955 family glycosylhydrolase n=1 Tax=Oryzobacter terrae TaxID=1620385 RepID=UPI0036715B2C
MSRTSARALVAAVAATALAATAACSASAPSDDASAAQAPDATARSMLMPVGAGHVHAVAKDPASGRLLLATHAGLFAEGKEEFERVGPAIDLMGFTVAGPNHYYASGHPQPGSDLPNPVGLIESRDGGQTWQVLSRGGTSDFHAMAAAGSGIAGFDGTLRFTEDGKAWDDLPSGFEPISITGRVDDRRLVASTNEAVMTSGDSGRTWASVPDSPAPALVSRADNAVIALTADGRVHLADASGRAWMQTELTAKAPQALLASGSTAQLEIIVLTEDGLMVSRNGRAFVPWTPQG